MHCLASILGEERIEEIVETIYQGISKYHGFYICYSTSIFIREQMTHLRPHLGGGLAPLDLSVREGDR